MIIDETLIRSIAPERSDSGHKGTFGTALVIAGSRFMPGAQVLATSACLASGVGIVRVLGPEESYVGTKVNCPCALISPYQSSIAGLMRDASGYMEKCSAVLIGPGIDMSDSSFALLNLCIQKTTNLVIDASALSILARYSEELLPLLSKRTSCGLNKAILTPHIGEMRRLLKVESRISEEDLLDMTRKFASDNDCIVVLKSAVTSIIESNGVEYSNIVTNSGMAKGGSGDVLAGLMTGFLAQGIEGINAAVSAVFFHSLAGGIAAGDIGKRAMQPTDIIDNLSYAYETVGWK